MKQIPIRILQNALEVIAKTHQVDIDPNLVLKSVERTRDLSHGDFASNIAMMTARNFKSNPRAVAQMLIDAMGEQPEIAKIEIAGPGFLNFTFHPEIYHQELASVVSTAEKYGHNNSGCNEKVQIEFVSANPTGPLHVGHGRGAAVGDSIARVLEANGFDVTREFYYNDAGAQIDNLATSVKARIDGITPDDAAWIEDGYRGEYIIEIAKSYLAKDTVTADDRAITASGDPDNIQDIRDFAVAYLRREQDLDLKAFDINFDIYYLESSLYKDGAVESTVNRLIEKGVTYEEDGALWLRTTDYGDDKDRVMRKKEGGYTYFVPDVAYHEKKWTRGFKFVINEQGADHHGTISRVRAGLQALDIGIPQGWPEYILHQMVMVLKDGQEVKISKRAGSYVTLRDLIDEVGKDATRYFLAARNPDSQLQFDIDLALSQSSDNPVYYIQYAHARICSILAERQRRNADFDPEFALANLDKLTMTQEYKLMRTLSSFGEIITTAGNNRSPHLIANYLQDLAADVHSYYNVKDENGNAIRILTEDADAKGIQDAKLYLLMAAKQVLANGLSLLGLSAPEKM